jgi:hypothetical protein
MATNGNVVATGDVVETSGKANKGIVATGGRGKSTSVTTKEVETAGSVATTSKATHEDV